MPKVNGKSTFVVLFGNRGFFPPELIAAARQEFQDVLGHLGHNVLMMPSDATAHGALSNRDDAQKAANFLKEHEDQYQGVIISLPNFGDESSLVNAVKDVEAPILVHAYPDDLDKMAPATRRDAFCGKFSVLDVFFQYNLKFTNLKPHVVAPTSDVFAAHIQHFDRVCRVVKGLRGMVVGAIGARTTAFKTVRVDELALQSNGITMEVVDLSEVFKRMQSMDTAAAVYKDKREALTNYTRWGNTPESAKDQLTRLAVVLDELWDEWQLDAMALRCWIELQRQINVSPCVLLSYLNDCGKVTACEVDVANAITMYALQCASGAPTACLDWNNNYGDDEDRCILFHCGSTAQSMMTGPGLVGDHSMLQHDPAVGPNCSYGCNEGRIRPFPFAFGSMTTRNGQLEFYLGQGRFTDDIIPDDFFGCGGVARIDRLQDVLHYVGANGHRHHVSVTEGENLVAPIQEALSSYLDFSVALPQQR